MKITHPYAIIINMAIAYIPLMFIDWRLLIFSVLIPVVLYMTTIRGCQLFMVAFIIISLAAALFLPVPFIYLLLLAAVTAAYFIPADAFAPLLYFQLYYLIHLMYQADRRELLIFYVIHMIIILVMTIFGRSREDLKYMLRRIIVPMIALVIIFGAAKIYYPVIINALPSQLFSFIDFEFKPQINDQEQQAIDKLTRKGEKLNHSTKAVQSKRSKTFIYWLGAASVVMSSGLLLYFNRRKILPDFQHEHQQIIPVQHTFRNDDFEFSSQLPNGYIRPLKRLIKTGYKHDIYYEPNMTFNEYIHQFKQSTVLMELLNEYRYNHHAVDRSSEVKKEINQLIEQLKQKSS